MLISGSLGKESFKISKEIYLEISHRSSGAIEATTRLLG